MQKQTIQRSSTTTGSRSESESKASDIPLDVVFDLLSNSRRRHVLRYLLTESPSTTLGDLAEYIAGIENEKPEQALSSAERKRVYISLYQSHLPKMDEAGVINFENDRKTVELTENAEAVTRFLPEQIENEPAGPTQGWLSSVSSAFYQVRRHISELR